jgi:toxin FitB
VLTHLTIEKAIEIRQNKKIELGDAIIAATAFVHNLELHTRNIDDFKNIAGLVVIDPMS